jgi:hypothetical protein
MKQRSDVLWEGSYQPADRPALQLLARATFWKMYAEMDVTVFESLRHVVRKILFTYIGECVIDKIAPFAIDPVAFCEIFRFEREPTKDEIATYGAESNYVILEVPLQHSHKGIVTAREQARLQISEWCDQRNLKDDWCKEHIASCLRIFWGKEVANFKYSLGAWYEHWQRLQKTGGEDPEQQFATDWVAGFDGWLQRKWSAFEWKGWQDQVERLNAEADRARAAPGYGLGSVGFVEYFLAAESGMIKKFPVMPKSFLEGSQEEWHRKRESEWLSLEEEKRALGQLDGTESQERERAYVKARERFNHPTLPIFPGDVKRLGRYGAVKPKSQFMKELKADLERCFKEAFDQMPARYLPQALRTCFVRKAWERCERKLKKYNDDVDEYLKGEQYDTIARWSNFELDCKRLIRRLFGMSDEVSADCENKEANAAWVEGEEAQKSIYAESVRQGSEKFAKTIELTLYKRKPGRKRNSQVGSQKY